jgi:hypothetical protein
VRTPRDYSIFPTFSPTKKDSCDCVSAEIPDDHYRGKSMWALSIVVGGCLVLNVVVVVALTLRREQPPVGSEK